MKKILIILILFLCIKVNASTIIMDMDSGRVLYSQNINEKIVIKNLNYSLTIYDLSLITKYIINNKIQLKAFNIDKNIYDYFIGINLGFTKKNEPICISVAKKDNKTILIVSINDYENYLLHKKIYEKYFSLYYKYKLLNKYTFKFKNRISKYYIKNDFDILLTKQEKEQIKIKIDLNKNNILIYLSNKLIHIEPLYKIKYKSILDKLKDLLLFLQL